jgi:Domain of unknown function (DUF4396)
MSAMLRSGGGTSIGGRRLLTGLRSTDTGLLVLGLAVGGLTGLHGRGYRQRMPVMEAVWPVTALDAGPLAVRAYGRSGRAASRRWLEDHGRNELPRKQCRATSGIGVAHCGAGCTLGDVISEFVVFGAGVTIAGTALWAEFIGDDVLAALLGLLFPYFAIARMRGLGVRDGIAAAAEADILSLSAVEVGHLHPDSPVYGFLMRVGMLLGFLTACPAGVWLVRRGIKEEM